MGAWIASFFAQQQKWVIFCIMWDHELWTRTVNLFFRIFRENFWRFADLRGLGLYLKGPRGLSRKAPLYILWHFGSLTLLLWFEGHYCATDQVFFSNEQYLSGCGENSSQKCVRTQITAWFQFILKIHLQYEKSLFFSQTTFLCLLGPL